MESCARVSLAIKLYPLKIDYENTKIDQYIYSTYFNDCFTLF